MWSRCPSVLPGPHLVNERHFHVAVAQRARLAIGRGPETWIRGLRVRRQGSRYWWAPPVPGFQPASRNDRSVEKGRPNFLAHSSCKDARRFDRLRYQKAGWQKAGWQKAGWQKAGWQTDRHKDLLRLGRQDRR